MSQQPVERVLTRSFLAEGVTRLGDAVTLVALPLTAVLVLDASPAELALIGAAQALPILVISLPLGAWVDGRRRRWPLLVVADLARAALLASVPVAAALGALTVPLLALIAMAASACGSLFDLAHAGWLPRILAGDDLHRANARVELARSAAAVGGPAIGGALVAALTAPLALLADAISFIVAAALVGSVRRAEPPVLATPTPGGRRANLTAGLRFVLGQRLVGAVTATASINNLARSIGLGIVVLYLIDVGLSAAEIGVAFGLGNTGFVVGSLLSRSLSRRWGMGRTMQRGVALFGPSMLAFALAPPDWAAPAFSAMLFANGFGIAIHNVNQVTVRQVLTPDHLRARAAAVVRTLIFGAVPIGTAIGGIVAELAGLRVALVVSGLGLCLGSVPYLVVRMQRVRSVAELGTATP